MTKLVVLTAALLIASGGAALAQPYSSDRASCMQPKCQPPELKGDLSVSYPKELRDAGKQGETVVSIAVGADGAVSDISVLETSHVPELDAGALESMKGAMFNPGRVDGRPVAMSHTIRFSFVKDSVGNLPQKTCADLNADVAFYRETFPGEPINSMRASTLTRGMFAIATDAFKGGVEAIVEAAKKSQQAFENSVAWCEENPGGMFLQRYRTEYSN